jgi:hypothetical protein
MHLMSGLCGCIETGITEGRKAASVHNRRYLARCAMCSTNSDAMSQLINQKL